MYCFGLKALRNIQLLLTDLAKYTAQKEAQHKATEAQSWGRQHLLDTNPAARMAPDTLLMHVLEQTDQLGRVEALVKNPEKEFCTCAIILPQKIYKS